MGFGPAWRGRRARTGNTQHCEGDETWANLFSSVSLSGALMRSALCAVMIMCALLGKRSCVQSIRRFGAAVGPTARSNGPRTSSLATKRFQRIGRKDMVKVEEAAEEEEKGGGVQLPALQEFVMADRDEYLFGDKKSFRELGVMEDLCKALDLCGKTVPTTIQSKSFPIIYSGVDVVIGAETGSGKTFSYLVPLVQQCLENHQENIPEGRKKYPSVIVMVPNKELCLQVQRMAQELVKALETVAGKAVHVTAVTSVSDRWPFSYDNGPDILICTPIFLSKFVRAQHATEPDLFRAVRHLVLDEADMLLEGSYLGDVEKVLDAFKFIRREMIHEGEIEVHETVLQHILSAATLPSYGLRSMEKYIERRYPRAVKVSNLHLHQHHPCIHQKYFRVSQDSVLAPERVQAIVEACSTAGATPLDRRDITEPTMIFVNTAETAAELAACLRDSGVDCAEFHKLNNNRQEGLKAFRDSEMQVLICTDHAARGLDLPHVRHVIQAEFALNVVQHLHRIGRASRAGVEGRATCFFDDKSEVLVESIQLGSIESSFSRRRGLRKKWKKVNKEGPI